ncbi:MAG: prepilin-type N-terminal cleavage/methylation domain-containing protein [Planctomycetes bacterium]|nr:prepilin-type N-terminal cleavage/methylation domain-containing protein [Planctomycetota bacterium]
MRRLANRTGQSGYTLLELLLVLVIVTGLTATVWPRFRRASRSLAVRAAARDLVALVARARLVTLSRREPVELRVTADTVTITRPQPRSFATDGTARPPQEEVTVLEYPLDWVVAFNRLQVLPADRAFVAGRAEGDLEEPTSDWLSTEEAVITFYPDGTSDDALIGLSDSQDDDEQSEYYVRVRGLVARATVTRALRDSDEGLFAEVYDAARDW